MLVRVRLDPDRLDEQRSRPASDCDGELSSSRRTRFGRRDRVQADVGRDPVEPRPQRPRALEAVEAAPGRSSVSWARPRRPAASRASGADARAARRGAGRRARGRPRRPLRGPPRARAGRERQRRSREAPPARARRLHSVDCGGPANQAHCRRLPAAAPRPPVGRRGRGRRSRTSRLDQLERHLPDAVLEQPPSLPDDERMHEQPQLVDEPDARAATARAWRSPTCRCSCRASP